MTEPIVAENEKPQPGYTPPETPLVFRRVDGFELRWCYGDLDISAYVSRITDKGRAEVSFYTSTVEQIKDHKETLLLAPNQVDFLSSSGKHNLVKQLQNIGHTDNFVAFCDWERKVNNIALAVTNQCRQSIPAVEVRANLEITLTANYVVEPIIYRDVPNIIFGDYGSLKSITSMVLAYIAQLPYTDNQLGLTPQSKVTTPVLWLDYEGQRSVFEKYWTGIQRGFNIELELPIQYKEMTVPLADAIQDVRDEMLEHRITMLVIDSLGPAAGGNLNDPEPAIRYHQALRTLGATSLTLAHNSKDPNTDTKSIFGSVFFSNLARGIWQVKAEKEPMSNYAVVVLKQIKASLSLMHLPMGLGFEFDEANSVVEVTKVEAKDSSLMSTELPLSVRIKDILRRGPMTAKEIEQELDVKENTLRATLKRLKDRNVTVKIGEQWAIRTVASP